MSMQHRSSHAAAALVAVAALLAGCGSSDRDDAVPPASSAPDTTNAPEGDTVPLPDPTTPVVQIRTQAMFAITPPFLPTEWTTISADGTVLLPFRGNAAAQPQVWPFEIGHVDTSRVEALLAQADAAGLLVDPAGTSTVPPTSIVDAPRTTIIITTADRRVVHVADALGTADETDPYRAALQAFSGAVAQAVQDGAAEHATDGTFYEPEALDIVAVEVTADDPGQGTREVVAWTPDAVDLSTATSCTTVTDPDTVSFLVGRLAGAMFQQGDRLYRVASRVHPPGTSCD